MATPPTVFISSTIYDFADLRSALRWWLKENGYTVYASEFNDIGIDISNDSYAACLKAIEDSDYFILLVGSRSGGWYSKDEQISITRAEYEKAYELFTNNGKPIIIPFVRRSLLTIVHDHPELRKVLNNTNGDSDNSSILLDHGFKKEDEAKSVLKFIELIKRTEDMKVANKNNTSRPQGNWVYPLSSFDDIVDTLQVQMNLKRRIPEQILSENLSNELSNNMALLLIKMKDKILPAAVLSHTFLNLFTDGFPGKITLPKEIAGLYNMFALGTTKFISECSNLFIENAVKVGLFMKYDTKQRKFCSTPLHKHIIRLYHLMVTQLPIGEKAGLESSLLCIRFRDESRQVLLVDQEEILSMIRWAEVCTEITNLHIRLSAALKGIDEIDWLDPIPSPGIFTEVREEIKQETITKKEANNYIDRMITRCEKNK